MCAARIWSSAGPFVTALLLVSSLVALAAWSAPGGTTSSSPSGAEAVSLDTYRALDLGRPREGVEDALGSGLDALQFRTTGTAVEPMDADCVYYRQAGAHDERALVQLCYRDDRLARKRLFGTPSG